MLHSLLRLDISEHSRITSLTGMTSGSIVENQTGTAGRSAAQWQMLLDLVDDRLNLAVPENSHRPRLPMGTGVGAS
jgi:hypothetical protein